MNATITDPTALSTRDLETTLLGLAGNLAAAQCRFLQLLAEFDRRDGWAGPGLRSCAHWLCWRIGMSLRTAAEHVRVAHALTRLPTITEAFAAGRVSYSKVRAITRIAGGPTPEPTAGHGPHEDPGDTPKPEVPALADDAEQVLLDLALAGTASHVEKIVRATRREQTDATRTAALRSLSWRHDDDGSLVLRGRFTADEGALLVATIEAMIALPQPAGREQSPGAVADRTAARRADALLSLVTGTGDDRETARDQARVVVHIEAATGAARIEGGPEIPATTAERIACDAQARVLLHDRTANRLYLGRSRRLASPAQIATLTVRDGPGCRFPGCDHTRHLRAHHVQHWFHHGRTDLDNLVLLCSFHHRLLHDRHYRVHHDNGRWTFERPDGTPVPEAGPPLDGNTEGLLEIATRAELRITRDSLTPTWGGERLDPHPILERLLPRPVRVAA